MLQLVQPLKSGKRGRPRKIIDATFVREAMRPGRNISLTKLASTIGVDQKTLRKCMKENAIERKFAEVEDEDLDRLVKAFRERYPGTGLRYLRGFLFRNDLRIQKERVMASIKRVDPVGLLVQQQHTHSIQRQVYRVARPNAVWHLDGHHKLIRWGVIIHASTDGSSRTVSDFRRHSLAYLCDIIR